MNLKKESNNISIVIPIFNNRDTVKRCLVSVRQQTFKDYEIIVVDDGSIDGGAEVAKNYLNETDLLISQDNRGVGAARNRGIQNAKGTFIAFIDADDEWKGNHLDILSNLSNLYPQAGLYATGYCTKYENGMVTETTIRSKNGNKQHSLIMNYFKIYAGIGIIHTSSVMVQSEVLRKFGSFIEKEPYGEDGDLWARIALYYPLAFDFHITETYHREHKRKINRNQIRIPRVAPIVYSLKRALDKMEFVIPTEAEIKAHYYYWLYEYFWDLVSVNDRKGIIDMLSTETWLHRYGTFFMKILAKIMIFMPMIILQALLRIRRSRLRLLFYEIHKGACGIISVKRI